MQKLSDWLINFGEVGLVNHLIFVSKVWLDFREGDSTAVFLLSIIIYVHRVSTVSTVSTVYCLLPYQ